MAIPALPAKNNTDWYDYLTALDAAVRGVASPYTDEQAQDAIAALFAGPQSGITFTYDDAGNAITAAVTTTTQYNDENAQDAFAALIAAGTHSGITFAYDDAGNRISATVLPSVTRATPSLVTAATYTFVTANANTIVVEGGSSSAQTFTVPLATTGAWVSGDMLRIYQLGTGKITLAAASGVTFQNPLTSLTTRTQYSHAQLRYRGSDVWAISGDLA